MDHPKAIHNSVPAAVHDCMNLIPRIREPLIFEKCIEDEISSIISNLKKEGGLNDISRRFLRLCSDHASKCISSVFNVCIDQGIFPAIFKLSKITPIFKKGKKKLIKNYRPIAILCNLSKIFESVIYNRIYNHFHSLNLLSEKQFGFR